MNHKTHTHTHNHQPEKIQPNTNHLNHSSPHDHDKHEGHSPEMFKSKFWLTLLLTIPTILYSEMVQHMLGFSMPAFTGSKFIPAILGTIIFFYGGLVFIKGAITEIQNRLPGMMTLVSLAILAAFLYSLLTTFVIPGTDFFWELATLIAIMLLGHWLEMKSVQNAKNALKELAKLFPDTATLENGEKVLVSKLKPGDRVIVKPGEKIPADGLVYEGESDVNESMITGESKPVNKHTGTLVIAGTINGSGSLKVTIKNVGEKTLLAGIMRLVAEAERSKSNTQILADKAAYYLTFIAITAGIITFIVWLLLGKGFPFALERLVTVLVIACPHALGLAIPLVTSISTGLGAKNGMLIKKRASLEEARNITSVVFDKTGTLTTGLQQVENIYPAFGINKEDVLHLAASVEHFSEHPIARAIVKEAEKQNLHFDHALNFKSIPGVGAEALLHEKNTITVGGPALIRSKNIPVPSSLLEVIKNSEQASKTIVYVVEENRLLGVITISDTVRMESYEAVANLKKQGIRVSMLTGDSDAVARSVANELKLDTYFAVVLPQDKNQKIKELQSKNEIVAMVGDGVNDAPALAQADIGIAVGAGTDVAIESAGIVLIKNDPRDVSKIIKLSRATYKKMQANLFWATGYNLLAIPLAAGVLSPLGINLDPSVGAVLMSLSTIIVALNSQTLRKLQL